MLTLAAEGRFAPAPPLILWAWERPEDLRFLNPQKTGVAFLVAEAHLIGERVYVHPRRQPLFAPKGIWRMAVIRLETNGAHLDDSQRARLIKFLRPFFRMQGIQALQVDFDAKASERSFYRAFLKDLRGALPAGMPLSITALVSWCVGDPWIRDLKVDEVVPMYFQMGKDTASIRRWLASGKSLSVTLARGSMGLSTDEPQPCPAKNRRVYVFTPHPWTSRTYSAFCERLVR